MLSMMYKNFILFLKIFEFGAPDLPRLEAWDQKDAAYWLGRTTGRSMEHYIEVFLIECEKCFGIAE